MWEVDAGAMKLAVRNGNAVFNHIKL